MVAVEIEVTCGGLELMGLIRKPGLEIYRKTRCCLKVQGRASVMARVLIVCHVCRVLELSEKSGHKIWIGKPTSVVTAMNNDWVRA